MYSMLQYDFISTQISIPASSACFLSPETAHRAKRYVGHEYGSELSMIFVAKILQHSRND